MNTDTQKTLVKIDDFAKLEIRVGTVRESYKVDGSDKLLRLIIDFGEEIGTRQIFTGMAKFYECEFFLNKQIVAIINLEPRKMMGSESQGMVLSADGLEIPVPLTILNTVENGALVR